MISHRGQLLDFCTSEGFTISNTFFEKPNSKLCTYKGPRDRQKQERDDGHTVTPHRRDRYNYYDTKDYWLSMNRWKNSACDCESDDQANVDSDHFPLILDVLTKLRAKKQTRKEPRLKYAEASKEEGEAFNNLLRQNLEAMEKKAQATATFSPKH